MDPSGKSAGAREATLEAILEAARRRYVRFGPRKTTMGEVAREAGCSRTTLYAHFPSKRELYTGLLERETETFLRELEAAVASSRSARGKLREIFEATVRSYAGAPVLHGALAGDDEMALERVARPVVESHEKRVVDLLREVLEEGIAEGTLRPVDAGAVSYVMYQLGLALVTREVAGRGDYPFERILGVMDDLLARGVVRPRGRGANRAARRTGPATSRRLRKERTP